MTTVPARLPDAVASGLRVLAVTALVAGVAGLMLAAVGGGLSGAPALRGALVGTCFTLAVFVFGAFTLEVISQVMPSASLLMAMLTYALQVLVMALFMIGLDGAGALDEALDGRWLGGAVIAVTMCWMSAHLVLTLRRRIPVFDLPAAPDSHATRASAR